jgi:hypothetical protein
MCCKRQNTDPPQISPSQTLKKKAYLEMNPAFLTMLWPVLEGAVGHHVKNKRQVEAIMTAVRGKIDEGLSGEM